MERILRIEFGPYGEEGNPIVAPKTCLHCEEGMAPSML
jgi:hypothetical protein